MDGSFDEFNCAVKKIAEIYGNRAEIRPESKICCVDGILVSIMSDDFLHRACIRHSHRAGRHGRQLAGSSRQPGGIFIFFPDSDLKQCALPAELL